MLYKSFPLSEVTLDNSLIFTVYWISCWTSFLIKYHKKKKTMVSIQFSCTPYGDVQQGETSSFGLINVALPFTCIFYPREFSSLLAMAVGL